MFIQPKVVAIVNVTPDSFSGDGCLQQSPSYWSARLNDLFEAGADYIDIGAESSVKAANLMSAAQEQARLAPVMAAVECLSQAQRACLSIDTRRASIAEQAARAGFGFVNDVSGGRADPDMLAVIAAHHIRYIMMYCKNASGNGDKIDNQTPDILEKITCFFEQQLALAHAAGVSTNQIILDPGMGYFISPRASHSLAILQALPRLKAQFGHPLFVGLSRKGFLAQLSPTAHKPAERLGATLALHWLAALQGADFIRVHDVRVARQFLDTMSEVERLGFFSPSPPDRHPQTNAHAYSACSD